MILIPSLQHQLETCPSEVQCPGTSTPPLLMLGSQPWGWVVLQGRSCFPSGVPVVQGVSKREAWAGNGPWGLLHVKLWDLGQKGVNTREPKSSLGFQTTMQKKGGRWQTWDHSLSYFLGQIMNLCLIPVGFRPLGCLCCSQASLQKHSPKGSQSGCQ